MLITDIWPLVLALTTSVSWWFIRRATKRTMRFGVTSYLVLLFALPWFSGHHVVCRGLTTLACCAILAPKLFDAYIAPDIWASRSFGEWMKYLLNPFVICYRRHLSDRYRSSRDNQWLVIRGVLEVLAGVTILVKSFGLNWAEWPFWLEHITKLVGAYLAIFDGGFVLMNGLLRYFGGAYMEFSRHPALACTPADFWRRYNRDAGRFLYENVYVQLIRWPGRARIAFVFLFNGLLHEYLVFVVSGQFFGVVLAFFAIQAIAVLLTWRLRPSGLNAVATGVATLVFNVATTTLFFEGVDTILPWYVSR